jgi:hypothetical protein
LENGLLLLPSCSDFSSINIFRVRVLINFKKQYLRFVLYVKCHKRLLVRNSRK